MVGCYITTTAQALSLFLSLTFLSAQHVLPTWDFAMQLFFNSCLCIQTKRVIVGVQKKGVIANEIVVGFGVSDFYFFSPY